MGCGGYRMGDGEREYEYKPKWTVIVFCVAFCGSCAVVLGFKAANNERGVTINHLIELGPDGATAFFWSLTACSCGFVAIAVHLAYHRIAFRQRLAFGPASLTVPVSRWSHVEKEIAYSDIKELTERTISGQRFLYVTHPGGKYTITAAMLPSRAVFDEVCELLAARVRESWTRAERGRFEEAMGRVADVEPEECDRL